MANTLTLTASHDYSLDAVGIVDDLVFQGSADTYGIFNPSQLSTILHVEGDGYIDTIEVDMTAPAAFSAANWTLSPPLSGLIWLGVRGSSGDDTITGNSSAHNGIAGGGGADTMVGGNGPDQFQYSDPGDIQPGETINGKGGTDAILIYHEPGGAIFDLSGVGITHVEELIFGSFSNTVVLNGNQIGRGHITAVDASFSHAALIVIGSAVDLSLVEFRHWYVSESISIKGTAARDTLNGSGESDSIVAGAGKDSVKGNAGNDIIDGEAGKDSLSGGEGKDWLKGGGGKDKFVFDTTPKAANLDHIADFAHGQDTIVLKHGVFRALSAGHLASNAFHVGTHSTHAADRIIYDQAHGKLYYDSDGNGGHAKTLVAILDNHAALAADDFLIV